MKFERSNVDNAAEMINVIYAVIKAFDASFSCNIRK